MQQASSTVVWGAQWARTRWVASAFGPSKRWWCPGCATRHTRPRVTRHHHLALASMQVVLAVLLCCGSPKMDTGTRLGLHVWCLGLSKGGVASPGHGHVTRGRGHTHLACKQVVVRYAAVCGSPMGLNGHVQGWLYVPLSWTVQGGGRVTRPGVPSRPGG